MALPYPKCSDVSVDLLAVKNFMPTGCVLKNGVLSPAFNAEITSAEPVKNLVCLKSSKSAGGGFAYTNDGGVYRIDSVDCTSMKLLRNLTATTPVFIEQRTGEYPDFMLITDSNFARVRRGGYFIGAMKTQMRCAALRCGRTFAADLSTGFIFKWSGEGGFNDWDEGISGAGHVYLDPPGGQTREMFDFENEIVLMRERGITRFSVSGNPENFRMIQPTLIIPDYYNKTAAVVSDKIFFCAHGGLHYYCAGKIKRLEGLISEDIFNPVVAQAYLGRFYAVVGYSNKLERTVVYIYDVINDTYQTVDVPAYYIAEDGISLVAFSEDAIYRIHPEGKYFGDYELDCGNIDFGTPNRKLLKKLICDCEGEVKVCISNGRHTRKITAGGTTRLNMRGAKFKITVTGNGIVRSLKLEAEVRK